MFDEHPGILERTRIGQKLDSFLRGELSAPVLGVDPLCSAAAKGTRSALGEAFESRLHKTRQSLWTDRLAINMRGSIWDETSRNCDKEDVI